MSAPYTQLNNGYLMPTIGLGVRDIDPEDVYGVVKDAVDAGFRHFDCATLYDNEKEVGQALREKIEEGVVTRQELFVTSKLWKSEFLFHGYSNSKPAIYLQNYFDELGD